MVDSPHLGTRRRLVNGKGRSVKLRRQTVARPPTFASVTVTAFVYAYRPDKITGDLKQGDVRCEILNDEIAAAAWPGPPKIGDSLIDGANTLTLIGAFPLYDGATLLGHTLIARGTP